MNNEYKTIQEKLLKKIEDFEKKIETLDSRIANIEEEKQKVISKKNQCEVALAALTEPEEEEKKQPKPKKKRNKKPKAEEPKIEPAEPEIALEPVAEEEPRKIIKPITFINKG